MDLTANRVGQRTGYGRLGTVALRSRVPFHRLADCDIALLVSHALFNSRLGVPKLTERFLSDFPPCFNLFLCPVPMLAN